MPLSLFISAVALSSYEFLSLVVPLSVPRAFKLAGLALLLLIAFRGPILQKLGGGMFFAPEMPQSVLVVSSFLYSAFFLMLFLLAAKDIVWLIWKVLPNTGSFPRAAASAAVLVTAAVLSAWGTWNALKVPPVQVRETTLERLPKSLDGTKIALLADLHISAMNKAPLIEAIVEKTNALSPDLILLNGDLIDGKVESRKYDDKPLEGLRAKYGVFASPGNHEYYSGFEDWRKKFKELGITLLDNQNTVIDINGAKLALIGTADQAAASFGMTGPDLPAAMAGLSKDIPVILMEHRPDNAPENSSQGVDLQLSGHTHGGMVIGFDRFIARFNRGFVRGWYDLGKMKLFVSPGTLLWNGFALRLGVPSEITLLVLRAPR